MTIPPIPQSDFNEITQLIHAAQQRAVQAVNEVIRSQISQLLFEHKPILVQAASPAEKLCQRC